MSEHWPSQPAKLDEPESAEVVDEELPADEVAEEEEEELPPLRAPDEKHAYGELDIPDDVNVIEGEPDGARRGVAIVAARFNAEITNRLLDSALDELDRL